MIRSEMSKRPPVKSAMVQPGSETAPSSSGGAAARKDQDDDARGGERRQQCAGNALQDFKGFWLRSSDLDRDRPRRILAVQAWRRSARQRRGGLAELLLQPLQR